MQINKINYTTGYGSTYPAKRNKQNIQKQNYLNSTEINFTGINSKLRRVFLSGSAKAEIAAFKDEVGTFLSIPMEKAEKYVTMGNKKRMFFFSKIQDFIKEIAQELSSPKISFDPKDLERMVMIKRAQESSALLNKIPTEVIKENYSEYGHKLLSGKFATMQNWFPAGKEPSPEEIEHFAYILRSTNKNNFELRQAFMQNNFHFLSNSSEDIAKLFKKLDSDKDFNKLYEKLVTGEIHLRCRPIREILYYADSFGSKILNKNSKSFFNILRENSRNFDNHELMRNVVMADLIHHTRIAGVFLDGIEAGIMRAKRIFKYHTLPREDLWRR